MKHPNVYSTKYTLICASNMCNGRFELTSVGNIYKKTLSTNGKSECEFVQVFVLYKYTVSSVSY